MSEENEENKVNEENEAVQVAKVSKEARLEERKLIEEGLEKRQKIQNEHEIVVLKMKLK